MSISARTRFAAVLGWPVEHSRSPELHNAAFAALGIDAVYLAMAVPPERLADAVAGLRAVGVLGLSITVPHKTAIMPLCDRVAPVARRIGAVNCVEIDGDRLIGHNTDAAGFVDSVRGELGREPRGQRVVLLGGGGAARAVAEGLREAGAEVSVIARTPARVDWIEAAPWTTESLQRQLPACDLLVDCTSMGLDETREASPPAPIPTDALPDSAAVATLIYHRETALLAAARRRGLAVMGGAGMLVHQGARAFEHWTGQRAPLDAMWAAMRAG